MPPALAYALADSVPIKRNPFIVKLETYEKIGTKRQTTKAKCHPR